MKLSNDEKEYAKDFRSNKAYEIIYEKENPSYLELQFLMFWAEDTNNFKLKKLIKDHPKWKQKRKLGKQKK